ncbi:MAG: HEPN domain-containing protein [Thermoplasmatota archaeon]
MKPETARWFAKATEDLDAARFLFDGEKFAQSGFFAQQSAEKALKALLIEQQGKFPRIHELAALASEAKVAPDLVERCADLSSAYVAYRYPDAGRPPSPEGVEVLLTIAQEVLDWVQTRLS